MEDAAPARDQRRLRRGGGRDLALPTTPTQRTHKKNTQRTHSNDAEDSAASGGGLGDLALAACVLRRAPVAHERGPSPALLASPATGPFSTARNTAPPPRRCWSSLSGPENPEPRKRRKRPCVLSPIRVCSTLATKMLASWRRPASLSLKRCRRSRSCSGRHTPPPPVHRLSHAPGQPLTIGFLEYPRGKRPSPDMRPAAPREPQRRR